MLSGLVRSLSHKQKDFGCRWMLFRIPRQPKSVSVPDAPVSRL
jgi:hypothetical protein